MNQTQTLVTSLIIALAVSGQFSVSARAQEYADPATAVAEDPDFAVQGEYSGTLSTAEGETEIAAQIIALGEGKFRVVGYFGGFPGQGWDGEEPETVETARAGDEIVFSGEHATGKWIDGQLVVFADDSEVARLEKVERSSETLGKQPPENASVFFDGQSTDQFVSTKGGPASMTDDGLLKQGANSIEKFGDCHLHIEFRLPYQPQARGQGRGNSGVYLQGRYEVQVLDSFGLSGEHNECGGLYGIQKPAVNMCFPPLTWQTYDIDFTAARYDDDGHKIKNARITVRHNGVLIHDDVELPKSTTAAPLKESADAGFLHLQDHKNQVRYRNIWMVKK